MARLFFRALFFYALFFERCGSKFYATSIAEGLPADQRNRVLHPPGRGHH